MQNYNALKHRCMNILLLRILSFHSSLFQYFRLHFTMRHLYLYWGRIMVGVALGKPIWDLRLDFKQCIAKSQPLSASGTSPIVIGNAYSCLCPRMAGKWLGRFTAERRKMEFSFCWEELSTGRCPACLATRLLCYRLHHNPPSPSSTSKVRNIHQKPLGRADC